MERANGACGLSASLFCVGGIGVGVEGSFADSFRKCAWNGAGGYRPASASALSALRSGIAKGAINAAWDAIGEVIKAWATEGHSVAVPGLGTMRFGLRSKSIADVNKVGSDLITTRRVIFAPNVEIKEELAKTSINITCYDRNGDIVKRVTSSDDGNIGPFLCPSAPIAKRIVIFVEVIGKRMIDVLDIWKRDCGSQVMTPVQEEVIRHILRRRDALVVMPRGEERELCFQVPAMLMQGMTLVISPLQRERREGRTLYVRPERLRRALKWLKDKWVSLFVIDEAQCMGEWREDYQKAYENLGLLRQKFPWVPIVAMTSDSDDVMRVFLFSQLWLRGWACFEELAPSPVVAPSPALEAAPAPLESCLARQKRLHKNAYAKWSPEDDRLLLERYKTGASVKELAALFARNEGAIRSRLKKVET